jgi:sec-independent protein translocase protein TatA
MPNLGPWELGILLVIVLAIFGAGKLASLGSALGRGVKDFRKELKTGEAKGENASSETSAEPKADDSGDAK